MAEFPRTDPLDLEAWHAEAWAELARFMAPRRRRALLKKTYELAIAGNVDAMALLLHLLIPDARPAAGTPPYAGPPPVHRNGSA